MIPHVLLCPEITRPAIGLLVGQHVFVRLGRKTTGEMVQRVYPPIWRQEERGHIDLFIKWVPRTMSRLKLPFRLCLQNADYPSGGKMTVGSLHMMEERPSRREEGVESRPYSRLPSLMFLLSLLP